MTTLIIHPNIDIQRKEALELIKGYLNISGEFESIFDIQHPDLHIIDGTDASSIGIDQVKELLHQLQFQPYQSERQVGVILYSDVITPEAQNSLLKSLEEPGDKTEFILTVSHEKNILPTILSRTYIIHVDKILNQKFRFDEFDLNKFIQLDIPEKFIQIDDLNDKEKSSPGIVKNFLNQLTQYYRNKLITSVKKKQNNKIYKLSTDLKEISKAQNYISKNTNKKLTLENLILQLEHRII